jgi:hypothetical protein
MSRQVSIAAVAALVFGGSVALAQERPTYQRDGFPISPHQVQVLGPDHVREQSPTSTLTLGGFPASPHQLAVLKGEPSVVAGRRSVGLIQ